MIEISIAHLIVCMKLNKLQIASELFTWANFSSISRFLTEISSILLKVNFKQQVSFMLEAT